MPAQRILGELVLTEEAAPATPAAGTATAYMGTDHLMHIKDSTGKDNALDEKTYASRLFAVAVFR